MTRIPAYLLPEKQKVHLKETETSDDLLKRKNVPERRSQELLRDLGGKQPVAVLREDGEVSYRIVHAQVDEPAIEHVELDLLMRRRHLNSSTACSQDIARLHAVRK